MKTKRVFFALMATLLLPFSVMAQTPTPAPGTAVIAVSVYFDNGNTGTPVTVRLQCAGGTITPSDAEIIDPHPFVEYQHAFVVESIPLDPEAEEPGVECWVTQDPLDGYDTRYNCLFGQYMDLIDANPDPACYPNTSREYCHWTDVQPNDAAGCHVVNFADFQEVKVTKQWDISGTGGDETGRDAGIAITCNTWMPDGTPIGGGNYRYYAELGSHDYDADGVAVVTAEVWPQWYPEDSEQGNYCYATELDVDSSVEVESDCGSSISTAGMEVFVGSGDGCTIVNTVFFEGIPTLSQYGLAIMALLMLGVGFVGVRRFV